MNFLLKQHRSMLYKFFLLFLTLLMLNSCSSRFIYNRADWLLNWFIDDYIDFDSKQQRQFDQFLDMQMRWHRYTELPRYQAYLEILLVDIEEPISPEKAEQRFSQLIDFWQDFLAQGVLPMSKIFSSLSDRQVEGFLAQVNKEQIELEYFYKKTKAQRLIADRAKSMSKNLNRFIGTLTNSQKRRVSLWASEIATLYFHKATLAQRNRWQISLTGTLAKRHKDSSIFSKSMHDLFVTPSVLWPEEYRTLINVNGDKTFLMLSDVHKSLTSKQTKIMRKNIKKYIKDIAKLQLVIINPQYRMRSLTRQASL